MKIQSDKLEQIINSNLEHVYVADENIEFDLIRNYKELLRDSDNPNNQDDIVGSMLLSCFDKAVEKSVKTTLNILIEIGLLSLE